MNFDPAAAAGLITREIRSGTRAGETTKIAIARRTYPTDRADLWDAVTNAERLPRWFLPVSGDLSEGGRYQIEGNASGVVERCVEPESFAVTWEMRGQVSWLEVTLTPVDSGTALELAHEAHVDPELWSQFGPGAVGLGWDLALAGLALHVESGEALDPAEGAAFPTTPDGTAFVQQAAGGWADAAIGDGDEPGPAREAAERSVAFYTTPPDGAGS
jgi:uncharacterized protein YndB with AHSA1/START domain